MSEMTKLIENVTLMLDAAELHVGLVSSEIIDEIRSFRARLISTDEAAANISSLRSEFISFVESNDATRRLYLVSIHTRTVNTCNKLLAERKDYTTEDRRIIEGVMSRAQQNISSSLQ